MKTERRHELESNKLATELNLWGEKLRPYTSAILFGVAALLVLYIAVTMWNARTAANEAQAWSAYELALMEGATDYRAVRLAAANEDYAGTQMQEWAYLAWADRQLLLAASQYLVDRDAAKEKLTAIEGYYDQFSTSALDPEVKNRAHFGLARLSEMRERFDDAKKHYAQVEGALAQVAADRLEVLEQRGGDVAEVAKWLATAELPRPVIPSSGGVPGQRPSFDAPLPPTGTTQGPINPRDMFDDLLGPGGGDRYGDVPGGEAPAAGDEGDAGDTGNAADAGDGASSSEPGEAADGAATPAEDATGEK
jgi:hypothetical protein